MPGPRWYGFGADAKSSEPFQSTTPLRDLGPGIRRDERIKGKPHLQSTKEAAVPPASRGVVMRESLGVSQCSKSSMIS